MDGSGVYYKRCPMHATIDVRLTVSIDNDKTILLATLTEFITDQNIELVLLEGIVESLDARRRRIAVDEKQIKVDGEKKWLYATVDTESKLLLEIDVFSRRGTDPAAAFLHRLTQKHDVAGSVFLVDAGGYLTALARRELSDRLDYQTRNHIEK